VRSNYFENFAIPPEDLDHIIRGLEVLDVEGSPSIADSLLDSILRYCRNLKHLNVRDCEEVSFQAVVNARARLPGLRIISNASESDSESDDDMCDRCPHCDTDYSESQFGICGCQFGYYAYSDYNDD
jgi:hypothetical protein